MYILYLRDIEFFFYEFSVLGTAPSRDVHDGPGSLLRPPDVALLPQEVQALVQLLPREGRQPQLTLRLLGTTEEIMY